MGDLFGNVDLEQLSSSETPIINKGEVEVKTEEKKEETEKVEKKETPLTGIDISLLEESDSEIIKNNEEEENIFGTPAETKESPSSLNALSSLVSVLQEAGVFSFNEEEKENIKDAQGLIDAIAGQIKNNEYSDLSDNQKEYLEALRNGVPHDTYAVHKRNSNQYENITEDQIEESEDLQFELIRRKFLITGSDDASAVKYAKLAIENGLGEEDAKSAKDSLVNYEKGIIEKQLRERVEETKRKEKEETERLSKLKSTINEKSDLLPGITINSVTKEKIYNSLTNVKAVSEDNQPMNEVMKKYLENDEYKLRLHAFDVITKGFTDFSKFTKAEKSKAIVDLEEALREGSPIKGTASKGYLDNGQTTLEISKALKDLKL
jgi:hypothetical protein